VTREDTPPFDAFISYRHLEPDRSWARWLHRALETWRTPRKLVAEGVPERLERVFRDEDELPASSSLSDSIERALRNSRFLIVVCSPRTPSSHWVRAEISRFRQWGRHDAILALLIEGEPAAAFPAELRHVEAPRVADGIERPGEGDVEPLAADVRPRPGESARSLRSAARLRLLAVLLGCRFDDLVRRHEERRRRRRTILATAALLLTAVLGVTAAYALRQRDIAESRRAEAERSAEAARRAQYASDVSLANNLVERGLYSRARVVLEATEPGHRRFEFHHLWGRVDPAIRRWHVGRPVLDVLDAEEDGTPELLLTDAGVVAPDGVSRLELEGGIESGGFVGTGRWVLWVRGPSTTEVVSLVDGRRVDLSSRASGAVAAHPDAPLIAFVAPPREPVSHPGSRVVVLDLERGVEHEVQAPDAVARLAFRARRLVCVPFPGGTLGVPGDPTLVDLDTWQVWTLSSGFAASDEGALGAHHAGVVDEGWVAFGAHDQVGVYEDAPETAAESDQRQRVVARLPYAVEGVVGGTRSGWFAAWDAGDNVRWYDAGGGAEGDAERLAYGSPARVRCVVPTRTGAWTFVGDEAGGVASFRTGPSGEVQMAPAWATSRLTEYMGDNFGWAAHLRVDPDWAAIEMVELGNWVGGAPPTPRSRLLDLAKGTLAEAAPVAGAAHPLAFRLSSAERGWDDLDEPTPAPGVEELPVYVPAQRRVERRAVPEGTRSFAVSADGLTVAFQRADGSVSIEGSRAALGPRTDPREILAGVSSDGRSFATWDGAAGAFVVYAAAEGMPVRRIPAAPLVAARRGRGVSFSPDGERMACWIDPAAVGLFDTGTGRMLLSLDVSPSYPGGDVRFSEDGLLLWTKRSVRISSLGRDTEIVVWLAGTPMQYVHGIRPVFAPR